MSEAKHLFRVYESNYVDVNGKCDIFVEAYPVISATKCGWWVNLYGKRRFVRRDKGKFAAATVDAALRQFRVRKMLHVRFLQGRVNRIQSALLQAATPGIRPLNEETVLGMIERGDL